MGDIMKNEIKYFYNLEPEEIINKNNYYFFIINDNHYYFKIFDRNIENIKALSELRKKLREVKAEVKVYKNTLLKRALDDLKLSLDGFLEGPNAILFGESLLEPIKVIADFAKDHEKLSIRVGIISGDVADLATINEDANIPSYEGLLTMLAGGMIQYVRDLSIGLNLYAESLEK